ncbi:MAG: hypothetical protein V4582_17540 [Pseudomonadota bacterium]
MDTHQRIVAILHLIHGVLIALVLLLLALFFGAVMSVGSLDGSVRHIFGAVGALVFAPFIAMAIAQIIAAVYLLQGSRAARPWIIVFGALSLLNFPIGTALGVYTLWALLRTDPKATLIAR